MGQPTWNSTPANTVTVPERPGCIWTLALDWLTAGKLYRIQVLTIPRPVPPPAEGQAPPPAALVMEDPRWTPHGASQPCTADGDMSGLSRREALLLPEARLGALIAKIGGGTADTAIDKTKTETTAFTVGRYCVFKAPDTGGPLFLAMNESPSAAGLAQSALEVVISEAM